MGHFGQPNGHSEPQIGTYDFGVYLADSGAPLEVETDLGDGGQYASHALLITASAGDTAWSAQTAQETCTAFIPTDAKQLQRVSLVLENGQLDGEDDIYRSPTLAQAFPANAFNDPDGNPVQPGTFDIQYLYRNGDSAQVDSCSIAPGTEGSRL